ncbi:MAG: hypothetical protein ACTSWY_03850 [Promethearchaeota archaeon]
MSSKDRLWDIDLTLSNTGGTDIKKEKIQINELAAGDIEQRSYNLEKDSFSQSIEVNEFISTLNDPETESYSLTVNADNEIYCSIIIKNIAKDNISPITVNKIIPDLFDNVRIINSSSGSAEMGELNGDKAIIWTIEEIKANAEEKLELRLDVKIQNKDQKVRSGKIVVNYKTPSSLSGMDIDKFDAYTNNAFYIGISEMDETPDKYECQFTFENKSEFMVRLVNADVYDRTNTDIKYVDIDPSEIPPLPEGSKWESKIWEYNVENGEDPNFKTKVEFFVIADHIIKTEGILEINDLELAVASISGDLTYDVDIIPSFRESTFNVNMNVKNTGGADLNDIILTETIQEKFKPPTIDQVTVNLNGNEIDVGSDSIKIKGDTVSIELKELRNQSIGVFKPDDTIEITYPIKADKPSKNVKYISNVIYTANTFPAGKPIEVIPEPIEIDVVHIRKRIIKGKEITGLVTDGEYEITLYVVNTGKFDLENYEIIDKIPDKFEYSGMTLDPKITSLEGMDVLKWTIDKISPGDRFEIKYRLSGEGRPSDAQLMV